MRELHCSLHKRNRSWVMRPLLTLLLCLCAGSLWATPPSTGDSNPPSKEESTALFDDFINERGEFKRFACEEDMPSFRGGGIRKFATWVQNQVEYPRFAHLHNIQGVVRGSFIVEKDGSLSDVHITDAAHITLAQEVYRILKEAPKWEPGYVEGRAVRTLYSIPVVFKIN